MCLWGRRKKTEDSMCASELVNRPDLRKAREYGLLFWRSRYILLFLSQFLEWMNVPNLSTTFSAAVPVTMALSLNILSMDLLTGLVTPKLSFCLPPHCYLQVTPKLVSLPKPSLHGAMEGKSPTASCNQTRGALQFELSLIAMAGMEHCNVNMSLPMERIGQNPSALQQITRRWF